MDSTLEIISLYDNMIGDKSHNLIDSWGFSCLVKAKNAHVLFDVGRHPEVLLMNMKRMNIDPGIIDAIVLSHVDDDHSDGLFGLLEQNHHAIIYLVNQYSAEFLDTLKTYRNKFVIVEHGNAFIPIQNSIYSTGALPSNRAESCHFIQTTPKLEQSLVIHHGHDLIMMTGCAHFDIIGLSMHCYHVYGRYPTYILGGFHYKDYSKEAIVKILNNSAIKNVEHLLPTHCSGSTIVDILLQGGFNRYKRFGLGTVLEIPKS